MESLNSILFFIFSIAFLFQSIFHLPIFAEKDTIFPGNSFDSTSFLISPGGMFTMGFFTLPSNNFTYLGIWYTNEEQDVKVWIANRDIPIVGYATLKLDESGALRLVNRSGATLFNVSNDKVIGSGNKNYNNTRAMLEDSGNFIVYDDLNRTIWQSFDHPTDTLLPGMKIGYNHTTGQNWTLTSSTDYGFVSSGVFTMRFENYQNSPQLLIHRHKELYWASGPWYKSTRDFLFLQSSDLSLYLEYEYKMKVISDASGMYFTFQATAESSVTSSHSMLQLASAGKFDIAQPQNPDLDMFFCGGYRGFMERGCVVSALPNCREKNEFYIWYWDTTDRGYLSEPNKTEDNSSISLGDCMEKCWNACDCVACATHNNDGTGCMYWTEIKYSLFEDDTKFRTPLSRLHYLQSNKDKKSLWWRWIFFSLLFVPISALAYVRIKRRIIKGKENKRRDDLIHQMTGSNSFNYGDELERGIKDAPDVKIFSLKAIMAATNNFSDENKLGQGGYGPVYKGVLSDGREIAVKRLSKSSRQGILEFKSEFILISKLQHTNLVRLYGCCIHQEEKMLVYEFMPNKSLDFFLFHGDRKAKIDWQIRFNIIEGIAQGLLYLHKYSRMKVIHRDLKVSNILLDENMNPKIADFGLARIFQHDVTEEMTKRPAGTFGYMAPEYAMHGTFSIKSDVFSYGVIILEIVSGKKNSSLHHVVQYAWELWQCKGILELKDDALGESYDVKQLLRAIHVGLLCVQENANDRPTMQEVIYVLNNEIVNLPIPKQPAFFTQSDESRSSKSSEHLLGNCIQVSENRLTVTTMEAR